MKLLRVVRLGLFILLFSFSMVSGSAHGLKGHVMFFTGDNAAGVEVTVKELPSLTTVTGQLGLFSFRNIPSGNYTLVLVFPGFVTKLIPFQIDSTEKDLGDIYLDELEITSDEIIITGSKYAQQKQEIPFSTAILDAESKKDFIIPSFDQLMKYVPGIQMQADQISIRGSSGYSRGAGTRVYVAFDGVPLFSGDSGEIIWEMMPVAAIDKIEVLKGPASSLYGSTALGGVVNIISRTKIEAPRTVLSVTGGVFDAPRYKEWEWSGRNRYLHTNTLLHENYSGSFSYRISYQKTYSDSYRKNDFLNRDNVFFSGLYRLSGMETVSLFTMMVRQNRGNSIYWDNSRNVLVPANNNETDVIHSSRNITAITYKNVLSSSSYLSVTGSFHYSFWKNDAAVDKYSKNILARTELNYSKSLSPDIHLLTGAELSRNKVESDLFQNPKQHSAALYIQNDYRPLYELSFSAGVRADFVRSDGLESETSISPKFGMRYSINDELTFRASYGKAFRAPSLAEAFTSTVASGVVIKPNPKLTSEKVSSVEAGANYRPFNFLQIDAAVFSTRMYNLIEAGFDTKDGKIYFSNINDAKLTGAELTIESELFPDVFTFSINYQWIDAVNTTASSPLKYRPKHIVQATGSVFVDKFRFGAAYRYSAKIREFDRELFNLGVIEDGDKFVPISVIDLTAGFDYNNLSLPLRFSFAVKNILNYSYTEIIGNLAPLRSFHISISTAF